MVCHLHRCFATDSSLFLTSPYDRLRSKGVNGYSESFFDLPEGPDFPLLREMHIGLTEISENKTEFFYAARMFMTLAYLFDWGKHFDDYHGQLTDDYIQSKYKEFRKYLFIVLDHRIQFDCRTFQYRVEESFTISIPIFPRPPYPFIDAMKLVPISNRFFHDLTFIKLEDTECTIVHPISSVPKPQVSDATSGKNSEVEQTDAKQSIDDSDEK